MDTLISAPLFTFLWLLGMIIAIETGRRLGKRRLARDPVRGLVGFDIIEGSVFTLYGLLIAFTLTSASSRYDERRMLIAEEANDIGTAYLRIDLLPQHSQPELHALFKKYVDSRINFYQSFWNVDTARRKLLLTANIQQEIWNSSVRASQDSFAHRDASRLFIPAINEMIDITGTRLMAIRIHPPRVMYILLFMLGIGCSLLAGERMAESGRRSWSHILVFTFLMSVSVFIILAIEYPRMSFIGMESYDQILIDLRDSLG